MSLNRIDITTPEQVSLNYRVAGLGSRATACILDCLILSLVGVSLFLAVSIIAAFLPDFLMEAFGGYLLAFALVSSYLLLLGYFLLFEYYAAGRTPGKILLGIRVIQDNGQSLTFLASAVRNFIRIIDFLPAGYLVGMLMIFFHPKHKRIGDLIAGTIVIYQRKAKRTKQQSRLEREIDARLHVNPVQLELDPWTMKKIGSQEWKLLQTYIERRSSLPEQERRQMTIQVARILLPLLGLETANVPLQEAETKLFALYRLLKDEWQYELD